jgi:hypothetical protein
MLASSLAGMGSNSIVKRTLLTQQDQDDRTMAGNAETLSVF